MIIVSTALFIIANVLGTYYRMCTSRHAIVVIPFCIKKKWVVTLNAKKAFLAFNLWHIKWVGIPGVDVMTHFFYTNIKWVIVVACRYVTKPTQYTFHNMYLIFIVIHLCSEKHNLYSEIPQYSETNIL